MNTTNHELTNEVTSAAALEKTFNAYLKEPSLQRWMDMQDKALDFQNNCKVLGLVDTTIKYAISRIGSSPLKDNSLKILLRSLHDYEPDWYKILTLYISALEDLTAAGFFIPNPDFNVFKTVASKFFDKLPDNCSTLFKAYVLIKSLNQ